MSADQNKIKIRMSEQYLPLCLVLRTCFDRNRVYVKPWTLIKWISSNWLSRWRSELISPFVDPFEESYHDVVGFVCSSKCSTVFFAKQYA